MCLTRSRHSLGQCWVPRTRHFSPSWISGSQATVASGLPPGLVTHDMPACRSGMAPENFHFWQVLVRPTLWEALLERIEFAKRLGPGWPGSDWSPLLMAGSCAYRCRTCRVGQVWSLGAGLLCVVPPFPLLTPKCLCVIGLGTCWV